MDVRVCVHITDVWLIRMTARLECTFQGNVNWCAVQSNYGSDQTHSNLLEPLLIQS